MLWWWFVVVILNEAANCMHCPSPKDKHVVVVVVVVHEGWILEASWVEQINQKVVGGRRNK